MLSLAGKRVIGLAAIIGGILIVILGVTKPNPFEDTRSVYAQFETVQGLGAIGRDVRLAGVNVGTIGEVRREGDDAIVEMVLEKDFPVHVDARASMRPHTLFEGSSFIDLEPGSPSAPLLDEGEVIPLEQTDNYVTLDEALRILRPEIRDSLRDLAATGAETLRGKAIEGIQATLKGAPELTRQLEHPMRSLQGSNRRELASAITGMSRTVDAVASKEDQLIPLAQRLNRTAAAITVDGGAPLDATLAVLPDTLRELRDGAPVVEALVDRLDRTAVIANPILPTLTAAVEDATPLLEQSIPVLNKATPLIRDLRVTTARVTEAVPTLADLLETLDPVVDTFGGSVLPTLLAPSRTGPPTYQQLMATFAAAGGVWSTYQTAGQNPNGIGHQWNIATYIDTAAGLQGAMDSQLPTTAGTTDEGDVPCSTVAEISSEAAGVLESGGLCVR